MTSVWTADLPTDPSDPLGDGDRFDHVVVGAGITGLTTALLLARAGESVAVVEARTPGAVTTGNTTAKVSLLQGTKLSRLLSRRGTSVARDYVEANREGQQWLLRFCEDHGVGAQIRPAVTYASAPQQVASVRKEHQAARSLGLEVRWHDDLDVPFEVHGATLLPGQGQVEAGQMVAALTREVRSHGGRVVSGTRVVKARVHGDEVVVHTEDGRAVRSGRLVVATGMPFLDRGLHFARLSPQRSYALTFRGVTAPEGMYLSAGTPSRSVRDVPRPDGTQLMVGGSGHTVGRDPSPAKHLDELRAWTAERFPGAVETHAWAAQDYSPADQLPYVGELPGSGGRIHVATGYDKWGMTQGVAAARAISSWLLGNDPEWARPMRRVLPTASGAAQAALLNGSVGLHLAKGYVKAELAPLPAQAPPEGEGVVGRRGVKPVATSTVDGRTCAVSAVCTHLGGVLSWNDAEKSWDCPLHGSRFAADGAVLEGPATRPLARQESPRP